MSPLVRRVAVFGYVGSGNIEDDAAFETVLAVKMKDEIEA